MTADRIKEIQNETAFPDSISVCQALMKVWNECEQQSKRMYSEEEVLIILDKFLTSMIKGEKTGLLNQWFEQFKKK
jgi:hypothetical protein